MKTRVAVTYENGQVFQHFGHTEQFQIFTVEDGKILSEEIVSTNGSGHSLLADFLVVQGATVLICGGIGGGAKPEKRLKIIWQAHWYSMLTQNVQTIIIMTMKTVVNMTTIAAATAVTNYHIF